MQIMSSIIPYFYWRILLN